VPNNKSKWTIKENKILSPNNPVTLEWKNNSNLVFRKKIEIDNNYLFKIYQEVENNSADPVELYPYAQITRNNTPKDLQGFFILHEGFIAVLNDELKEDDYKDIKEKKITREANEGWIGITDKYWMTALVPEDGESFKSTFLYKDAYKANFLLNEPKIVEPDSKSNTEVKIFVAAKEVQIIDAYAEKEKIKKLDLIIDWGWFYFFTKPLFFAADYFFKLTGNFGIAIILITLIIRIVFFPLANYSFKSMAKMKVLQPEMTRLKDLHKDDKVKLQQAIMALYKKEQINPASGCLPVLIQIPFFFAIYKMLFISLEMRHQPFFGWIKDLSAQDPTSIFNLFGLIPWDPPNFLIIGVWPILMGLTMFIQQKLNPAPTDPIQAKIFMFFPIFLTVILAPFPSGLVVYWTINNILTIAQQWFIMRSTKVKTN
jgi:YidC/Oxa1 family membrane protein insertase